MTEKIPGPTGLPFLGNMFDVQSEQGYLKATERLAEIYGPVYEISLRGERILNVSSAELLMELMDDKVWVTVPLEELSEGEGAKGMFNAPHGHPDWYQARRILGPSFGPLAIESQFEGVYESSHHL